MIRSVTPVTVCPYGCRYFNSGWHAENCPGPLSSGASRANGEEGASHSPRAPAPAFLSEPEYQREQDADARDRRHEAYEDQRLTYTEKGLASE